MKSRDKVFSRKTKQVSDFEFNKKVADVFDDMLERSVPFYQEIQRMIVELGKIFVQPSTNVYDLGCSTGTTIITLCREVGDPTPNGSLGHRLDEWSSLRGSPYKHPRALVSGWISSIATFKHKSKRHTARCAAFDVSIRLGS